MLQPRREEEVESLTKLFLKIQPLECILIPLVTVIVSLILYQQHVSQLPIADTL